MLTILETFVEIYYEHLVTGGKEVSYSIPELNFYVYNIY
jgi:hypothetical protein